MSLTAPSTDEDWTGTVPRALDARVVLLVLVVAAFAAWLNVPYGGPVLAGVAYVLLVAGGVCAHLLGERRLRRSTDHLLAQWAEAGGRIDGVTRSSATLRTEWVVHTERGPVTVGGLALAPISRLTLDWDEVSAAYSVSDERDLDGFADEWFRTIFATPVETVAATAER